MKPHHSTQPTTTLKTTITRYFFNSTESTFINYEIILFQSFNNNYHSTTYIKRINIYIYIYKRYVGRIFDSDDIWLGIEFDQPVGKCDGVARLDQEG